MTTDRPAKPPPHTPLDVNFVRTVAIVYASCGLLFGTLMLLEWHWIDRSIAAVARERGAALFSLIETTREWNARHGGVYVPVTEDAKPNPYLKHPQRDITTTDGRALTMVNPAYMTRQIAEIAERSEGIQLHITSLDPIRAENGPDPWEASALARFDRGEPEVLALVDQAGTPVHRYMAPLVVVSACLQCHAVQGYKVGDIRGGISVNMPAQALVEMRDSQRWRAGVLHLAAFVLTAGLIHGLLLVQRRHLRAVRDLNAAQERLIARRTQELAEANQQLAGEVEQHRRSARQLADSEARYRAIFEGAAEGIMVTDEHARITQVNPAFCDITGYAADEVIGRSPALMASGRHDAAFFDDMLAQLARDGAWQGEIWNRRKSGDLYVQWMSVARIGDAAEPQGYVATLTDITQRKKAEEEIRYRADHDPLTGLPNRALFDDRLALALAGAHRRGQQFALLFVDLDFFKGVNDRYGHLAGDALLVEAGARLNDCVRESDTVARFGGDEFAVILNEVGGAAEAEEVASRIAGAIARPFVFPQGEAQISASIGVVLAPQHGSDAETLQRRADLALYAVKHGGRGRYRFYAAELEG